jgi:hypothetical protein
MPLSCLTFGLVAARESIYKNVDGEITVDFLGGVLEGKLEVPQTTGIGAYCVLCLPLFL